MLKYQLNQLLAEKIEQERLMLMVSNAVTDCKERKKHMMDKRSREYTQNFIEYAETILKSITK